ncbi:hypothetical protein [Vibrio rotiferianus]|uniref:hypothetical protein n=1 Tax=Vibrio rotiferianus TaxID=190895 RepID=UPI002894B064|nr:conserved hypothetical protein [Vibrio rotiferianus]CAH1591008.1 conserved hypothetical protein [Vibrio rotiferianus]
MTNSFYNQFPSLPLYKGSWGSVQIEPIIGSGERITIAVCAVGDDGDYRVVQSLSDELLEFLYKTQKSNMSDLINIITSSLSKHLSLNKNISEWSAPISGVLIGSINDGLDVDIDGVIDQGLRFSSSLSDLLEPNRLATNSTTRKRINTRFSNNILKQVADVNPTLVDSFNRRIRVADSDAKTSFGFLNDKYVSNFGLLTPSSLSSSLNNIKARIFDIEALKKSDLLFKPDIYEVIIGSPSFDDPTLSDKTLHRLKNSFEMVEEIADKDDIRVFRVAGAQEAASRIIKLAA